MRFLPLLLGASTLFLAASSKAPTPVVSSVEPRCRNVITVYVDLSETVTGRSARAHAAPLFTLVGAIRELLKRNTLLRAGDALSIIAFGDGQRTLYETASIDDAARSDIDQRLSLLENPGWETSAFVHDKIGQVAAFSQYTKFPDVLQDMSARLRRNHEGDRQLLFIASDFANDPDGDCDPRVHLENFEHAFADAITPDVKKLFKRTDGNPPLAQLTLLRVPAVPSTACQKKKTKKFPNVDIVVADGVVKQFRGLDPHDVSDVQQLSVDQLLRRLEAAFSAALQVTSAQKAGPTTIRVEIFNPNCADVTITGVRVIAAGLPAHEVDFDKPLELRRDRSRDSATTKDDPELAKYMNRLVDVAPLVGDAKTTAAQFWIGDVVRIEHVTPKLYPRFVGTGRVLLFIEANFIVSDGGILNVHIVDPPAGLGGDWSNEIVLSPSDGERKGRWILPLDGPAEAIKTLAERGNLRVEMQAARRNAGAQGADLRADRAPEIDWKGADSDAEGKKSMKAHADVDIVGEFNKYALPIAAFATVVVLLLTVRERRTGIRQGQAPTEAASIAFTTTYGCVLALLYILYFGSDGWSWFGRLLHIARVFAPIPVFTEALAAGLLIFILGREYLWRVRFRNAERRTDVSVAESNALLNRAERAVVYSAVAVTAVLAIVLSSGFHPNFLMIMHKATT